MESSKMFNVANRKGLVLIQNRKKTSLWFWPRGWHTPPMPWPEGNGHQQVSGRNKTSHSHLTLKTEVPERRKEGVCYWMHSTYSFGGGGRGGKGLVSTDFSVGTQRRASPRLLTITPPPGSTCVLKGPMADLSWLAQIGSNIPFPLPCSPKTQSTLVKRFRP